MLQPFLAAENSNIVQLHLSMEQGHFHFQSSTENAQSSNIVEQWFPCVRTFPERVNPSTLYLISYVDIERFLRNVRESKNEIHLILEKSISDEKDQHESLRRILAAISEQGKLTSLKCRLRENPDGFPMKTIVDMVKKCRLLRSLQIELNDKHKFELKSFVPCLVRHTIELNVCIHIPWDDVEYNTTVLISPDGNEAHNPGNQVNESVPDSFVYIDLKPVEGEFMTDDGTLCQESVYVQSKGQWNVDDDVGSYPHSVKVTAGLQKCPNLQFLHFGNCNLLDTQCDIVARSIQNAPLLRELDLGSCKIGNDIIY